MSITKTKTLDNTVIYFNTTSDKMFVKGLEAIAQELTLVNMLGQAVMTQQEVSKEALDQGIHISNLNTGVYIVKITRTDLKTIEKKIIID